MPSDDAVQFLNDAHGLMVFSAEPAARFIRLGTPTVMTSPSTERMVAALQGAIAGPGLAERTQIAYDFLAASMSEKSSDARLPLLMISVETLIEPDPRSAAVQQHIEDLIAATAAADLPDDERQAVIVSLAQLRLESIGRGAKSACREGVEHREAAPYSAGGAHEASREAEGRTWKHRGCALWTNRHRQDVPLRL
jgi:hypothetical protein